MDSRLLISFQFRPFLPAVRLTRSLLWSHLFGTWRYSHNPMKVSSVVFRLEINCSRARRLRLTCLINGTEPILTLSDNNIVSTYQILL